LYGSIADNDFFRLRVGGTSSNAGYVEIATSDDGTEPIYVRQYTGVFSSLTRTATLLDGSGNTSFPGTVSAPTFSGALSGNATTATTAGALTSMNISQFTNNSGYITGINSSAVTTALGYTPYNATNPNGYITGISFANVSSKPTTLSGYGITDGWQAGGSWGADLTSNGFTRQIGLAYTGGEFAILTNNAQISTLIDGTYFAGEGNGFYSMNSSNQYSSRVGFNRDSSGNASFNASIVPTTNGTLNLGSSSARWNTLFTSDLSLSNGIGDYTIVEGEDDLFLYNNKRNKVYKFMLQEVKPEDATPKRPE